MLNHDQIAFYHDHGFLHIPAVFSAQETRELSDHLNWLMDTWAIPDASWSGPWRKVYMDEKTEKQSKLIALHDLQFYSDVWARAVVHSRMTDAMADLLGDVVELHHSTLHVKPPETGHPFPMHQDYAFYPHADNRYVDCLVHLDDTSHANGEIRFLDGSHKGGPLEHVTKNPDGTKCTPHLPTDQYRLEETIPVPAHAGDLVVFNIHTIHGSYINTTNQARRLVRVGYRHPDNRQLSGQSFTRPGWIVRGQRPKREGQERFTQG